jgi:hypothetical protein
MKRINGTLLIRHKHRAGSPVKLIEGVETAPRSNRVLHHPPEAFDRVEETCDVITEERGHDHQTGPARPLLSPGIVCDYQ